MPRLIRTRRPFGDQVIRKYNKGDLAGLLDVSYDASQIDHWFWDTEFFDQERMEIREKYLTIAESWVFEKEGRVVGFISLIGNAVGGVFVTPGRQGHGIGRALLDHARASRDHLDAEVFEANQIGQAFYDAYGFDVVGTRVDEKTGQSLLRLRLDT